MDALPTAEADVKKQIELLEFAKTQGLTVDDLLSFFRTALDRAQTGDTRPS